MANDEGPVVDEGAGIEDYLEQELQRAPKRLTNHLFHYTSANAAIAGILRSGEFRLAPFDGTNDLWESRPLYPSMSAHADQQSTDLDTGLWTEIDKHLRRHAKVGCFTQDWELPNHVWDRDALHGWSHLSLWAHYGERHSGVCLRFDRERLDAALKQRTGTDLCWSGQVRYTRTSVGPLRPIDIGQISEFGVDAASVAFAAMNNDTVFFRKHADWATEYEHRLVLLGNSVAPAYLDVRDAINGVVLGEAFPDHRIPELQAELERYPNVELFQLRYHNRRLFCHATTSATTPQPPRGEPSIPEHRQPGDVHQRTSLLLAAVEEAAVLRTAGAASAERHRVEIENAMSELQAEIATWGDIDVRIYPQITAVPDGLRARAPGVPGESVYSECGLMCVGENLPTYSYTFVAAAAIQVLAAGVFRLHAVVSTERWDPSGNTTTEHWREQREASEDTTHDDLRELLAVLRAAVHRTRAEFDVRRGR